MLLQWDLSSGALHRPKLHGHGHPSYALSSTLSLALRRSGADRETPEFEKFHPAPSRMEVALIQPVVVSPLVSSSSALAHRTPNERNQPFESNTVLTIGMIAKVKQIEGDLLAHVSFLPLGLVTMTRSGVIKQWVRPLEAKARFGAK